MATRKTTKDGKERAQSVQMATDVLQIYSDGEQNPWKRARKKYPKLAEMRLGRERLRFNAETALAWAAGVVAGDPVKQARSAQVFQALADIGFGEEATPTVRLNALKLLGKECGMFTKKVDLGRKPTVRKMRHVFIKPK